MPKFGAYVQDSTQLVYGHCPYTCTSAAHVRIAVGAQRPDDTDRQGRCCSTRLTCCCVGTESISALLFHGWYARQDSNLWPLAPEASALSAELRARLHCNAILPQERARSKGEGRHLRRRGIAQVAKLAESWAQPVLLTSFQAA